MKFNINQTVRVKLTDHGRMLLKRNAHLYDLPEEDSEGWSRWQLWHLMREFGQYMGMTQKLCFENEIELVLDS